MDQAEWKATTTLTGAAPTPAALWDLIQTTNDLPLTQAEAWSKLPTNDTLKAGVAQTLAQEVGLNAEGIRNRLGSEYGLNPKLTTVERLLNAELDVASWKIRFTNLVSGRFTELAFAAVYEPQLNDHGLVLVEETQARNFLDYRIQDDKAFDLAINLKNAGMQMREAQRFFGLDPDDTLPMATYKAFGAYDALTKEGVPLLYVFLVDWTMLARLRTAYWNALSEGQRLLFQIMTSFKGLPRSFEDAFIEDTVGGRLQELLAVVGYNDVATLPLRVVSAGRAARIFYTLHHRSPYVYQQRMNTDPNVHISVKDETISFDELLHTHLDTEQDRNELIEGLQRVSNFEIPDPPI